jgi:hypothetical protein
MKRLQSNHIKFLITQFENETVGQVPEKVGYYEFVEIRQKVRKENKKVKNYHLI